MPEEWSLSLAQRIADNAKRFGSNASAAQIKSWAKGLEARVRSKSFAPKLTPESLTRIILWAIEVDSFWSRQVRSCPPVAKLQNIVAAYMDKAPKSRVTPSAFTSDDEYPSA